MGIAIWLGLFLPLIGFLVLLVSSYRISRTEAGIVACGSLLASFLCFATLLIKYLTGRIGPFTETLFPWLSYSTVQADFALHVDALSLLMALIITGVGFLIHVYANGYMDHDKDFCRFFACMNFFVFAMLLLVLAANLPLLFVGWEGVGLASYLLIGFWYEKPKAAKAAIKAFVVNRVGDLGLLLAIVYAFTLFGTGDMEEISRRATVGFAPGAIEMVVLTFLLFWGAAAKSAQIPLHVWLADAMEGPTPVSALIHAATMVTAGVYLVVRMHALFLLAPVTLQLVGVVGGVTALFAALSAVGQTDLKRVLAYSTVSQLGLMFLACGVGAFYAAMFHLTTHAFVKALLFLSAGNVVHMMHGTTQLDKMGGLKSKLPKTSILFLIGVLAMSALPPFAAFFSKELILEQEAQTGHYILFTLGLIVSVLTAYYLTRAYCLAFTGESRVEETSFTIFEAPRIMLAPLSILALLSICGGLLGFSIGQPALLESFLNRVDVTLAEGDVSHGFHLSWITFTSIAAAIFGIGLGVLRYFNTDRKEFPLQVLKQAFYIDQLYDWLFVYPLKGLARLIDYFIEPKIFSGMINGVSSVSQQIAVVLQRMQSGQIRSYVAWMAVGAVFLITYFVY